MIIIMKPGAGEKQIEAVIEVLVSRDFDVHRSTGAERTILGVVGTKVGSVEPLVRAMEGVDRVVRITQD